ncbi:MAG: 50S ribosomal protein L15 [Candidatus Heimdallarchaeota archaeon]|nr:50S ribosomal protein L15 [Candidatus Heimdallarchaeota archaeon]MCK4768961.1 uL15 family ribosomal protein [Candidatus Heimdallarchaeota archaeon]
MTVRTKRKGRKHRGSRTHGWGIVRTHRKSGMRGGVGNAGPKSHHWILTVKGMRDPIGKHGFKRPYKRQKKDKTINISHVEAMLPSLINDGIAIKKGNSYQINLSELGYKKLLAQGEIGSPLNLIIDEASEKAVEKIKGAGGKVTLKK